MSYDIELINLVPEKFRDSDILSEFLEEMSDVVGEWLVDIDGIMELYDPWNVERAYTKYLADLLGHHLDIDDDISTYDLRKQIRQIIDWVKMKGTYHALTVVAYLSNININIYDMFTNDYVNFVEVAWATYDEGENPTGLDSTYYKSPHFGLQVLLNTVYTVSSTGISGTETIYYLWRESMFTNWYGLVEMIRPVHTVPHYQLLLNPVTDETGEVMTVDGDIKTRVTENWHYVTLYFDMWDIGSSYAWDFDDGYYFDYSYSSFISSITKYKLGTGNKGVSPDDSGFALANVVITGDIESTTIYDDRTEFKFRLDSSVVQSSISELGLFLSDETTMVVASTFPDIDKNNGVELIVTVAVYK